jgi:hypothetical protein
MRKNVQGGGRVLARYAQEIHKLCRRTAADVIRIGKLLSDARKRMPYGSWLPWLESEFGWSADTADNFIRVHEFSRTAQFRKIRNLPSPSVLYLLANPNMPEAARAEIIERIEGGEKVKVADVKRLRLPVTVEPQTVVVPADVHAEKERQTVADPQPEKESVDEPVRQSPPPKPVEPVRQSPPPMDVHRTSRADADVVLHHLLHLSLTVRNSLVEYVIERAPERDELVEQVDVVGEFLSLLKEAVVGSKPPIPARPPEMPSSDDNAPVGTEPESQN